MRHAYLILAHRNFRIIELFLKLFDRENIDFYILIDKKVKDTFKELIPYSPRRACLFEVERISVNWGGFSQIRGELNLLKESIKGEYDYYHYLQGADFPIQTPEEIDSFFEENSGKEFVEFAPGSYEFAKYKCDYWHLFVENEKYRENKALKVANHGFVRLQRLLGISRKDRKLYHGSALFSITHDFAQYVIARETAIEKRYRYTLAADEVFLQTELYHSPFQKAIYHFEQKDGNVRYIDWDRRSGSSPHTFGVEDFDILCARQTEMFARKFDENHAEVIELLYDYLK